MRDDDAVCDIVEMDCSDEDTVCDMVVMEIEDDTVCEMVEMDWLRDETVRVCDDSVRDAVENVRSGVLLADEADNEELGKLV